MNLSAVGWLLGCVHLLLAAFMLVPAAVAALYGEEASVEGCLLSALVTAAIGGAMTFFCRGATLTKEGRTDYFRREGLAVVGLSWLAAAVIGALPFLLSDAMTSPVDAFFESASGFTTTGSTILTGEGIDGLSKGMAFWRSFTHWLGGIGIVLVFVVLFPAGGRSLFRSEVPGISREAVQQRVRDSALGLVRVYVGLTVAEVLLLWILCDLGPYEAFVHAFGTLATGGFSSHSASVAHFLSWKVEMIVVVFMFGAGINFAVYDTLLRKGVREAWRQASGSSEIRTYTGFVVGSTLFIAVVLWFWGGSNGDGASALPDYSSLALSLRDSVFLVVSMVTSTGYGTADFDQWPNVCKIVLMLLAVSGACAGSTGGGMKVVRILILAKAAWRGIRSFARPRAIHLVQMDGHAVEDKTVGMVTAYCGLWFLVFLGGTTLLVGMNIDPPAPYEDQVILTAATSVLATLNNIGPGLEAVGPALNFSFMPDMAKLLLSFLMILGRLEFYAVLTLFSPRFWRD